MACLFLTRLHVCMSHGAGIDPSTPGLYLCTVKHDAIHIPMILFKISQGSLIILCIGEMMNPNCVTVDCDSDFSTISTEQWIVFPPWAKHVLYRLNLCKFVGGLNI